MNLLIAIAIGGFYFRFLSLRSNDDGLDRYDHIAVVTHSSVIAQVPRQWPVVWRNYRDSGLAFLMCSLSDAIYLVDEFECISTSVGVNINVVAIVVIVVKEIEINCLVAGNESLPMRLDLGKC